MDAHYLAMEKFYRKMDCYVDLLKRIISLAGFPDTELKTELSSIETLKAEEFAILEESYPPVKKIRWLGNLKEFAELITVLEAKGWIEPIEHGELSLFVRSAATYFDLSNTQKKSDSNTEKSLMQYLKPSERDSKIFSKRYIQKFNAILANNLKK